MTVPPQGSEFGDLISQKIASEGETFYHHYDGLGSTAVLTDALGVTTDEYDYEAFGKTAAESGPTPNPYKWVGRLGYRYDEETDLYDVRRRKYAPDAGRFLSEDPVRDQEENLYRYVGNQPTQRVDPSGLFSISPNCGVIPCSLLDESARTPSSGELIQAINDARIGSFILFVDGDLQILSPDTNHQTLQSMFEVHDNLHSIYQKAADGSLKAVMKRPIDDAA